MKEKINQYLNLQKELKSELREWVKDESIPLIERYDLFLLSGLGEDARFYLHPPCIDWNRVNLEDNFYLEKYSQCSIGRFIETALENKEEWEDGEPSPYDECGKEKLIRYFMIDKFVKSFTHDW